MASHHHHPTTPTTRATAGTAVTRRAVAATVAEQPPRRHHHLVDLENLGVEHPGGPILPGTGELYRRIIRPGDDDLFVVGADAVRIFEIRREFPGARLCAGRGPDGAERSIIDRFDLLLATARFDGITIASGDGYFTNLAHEAHDSGLWVRVVSRRGRLAQSLRLAADEVILLPHPHPQPPRRHDGGPPRHRARRRVGPPPGLEAA